MIGQSPARLVLHITDRDGGLMVRAAGSPAGGTVESAIVLQRAEDVLRTASQPTFHEDVGRGLFRSLFAGPLRDLYRAAITGAAVAGEPLTLELCFARDAVRAARYPWELLHDGTRFLLRTGTVSLVRSLPFPDAPHPAKPGGVLEVLVAAPRPRDYAPHGASRGTGFDMLAQDFARADRIDLAALFPPTWDALMDWTLAGAPDVLHFEGGGESARSGRLFFEDAHGRQDPVDAAALGEAFFSTALRLVMLANTAPAAEEGGLESAAPTLILTGIPAAVALQGALPEDAARSFARTLYESLLSGDTIEAAAAAGRKTLVRTTCWHLPALYRRAPETLPGESGPVVTAAGGSLPRRIDTAAPETAVLHQPLRVALWLRAPDALAPGPGVLYRLLGAPLPAPDAPYSAEPAHRPAQIAPLQPGTVTVRVVAPGFDVNSPPVITLPVRAGVMLPPAWFSLTPRRAGTQPVIFEVVQAGQRIAAVVHPVRVTPRAITADAASPAIRVVCHAPEQ